jgi:hypothetical protein
MELLVSVAVLVMLILLMMQLFSSATATATLSRKDIDVDEAARLVFDRMGSDLARMVRRADVNYIFCKNTSAGSSGSNDAMFFYSEGPGYLDPSASSSTSGSASTIALLGYRINPNNPYYPNTPVLERLGENLTWGGAPDTTGTYPGAMVFLPATLAGNWPNVFGAPPYLSQTTEHYQVLSDVVFRMEFCFLLKSGTYSIAGGTVVTGTTGYSNEPTAISGTSAQYVTGNYFTGQFSPDFAGNVYGFPPDLAAIVVTVAVLDNNSRKLIPTGSLNTLGAAFSDSLSGNTALGANGVQGVQVNPQLTAHVWQSQLQQSGFAQSVGIPQIALAQVRIYERTFYLNAN